MSCVPSENISRKVERPTAVSGREMGPPGSKEKGNCRGG